MLSFANQICASIHQCGATLAGGSRKLVDRDAERSRRVMMPVRQPSHGPSVSLCGYSCSARIKYAREYELAFIETTPVQCQS